ncbi:MAG: hypothetical protein GVY22_11270 [Gammaproteobacteria bacterium]|jgi:hypothetical protein|nr:hypothetical protein [Gammaproteobacteria bacterium]
MSYLPSPWHCDARLIRADDGTPIARLYPGIDANQGRLIAAAPDLLLAIALLIEAPETATLDTERDAARAALRLAGISVPAVRRKEASDA